MIVYLLVNKTNGKVYVGQTSKSLHLRWQLHQADARFGRPLRICRAIRKYGSKSFERYEMGSNLSCNSADNLERLLIAIFNATNPLFGYNSALGGCVSRGWKASESTRLKQRLAKLGKKRGPRSPEHCANIRKSKMGHSVSIETRNKISQTLKRKNNG